MFIEATTQTNTSEVFQIHTKAYFTTTLLETETELSWYYRSIDNDL
jgi:hypothetical protein